MRTSSSAFERTAFSIRSEETPCSSSSIDFAVRWTIERATCLALFSIIALREASLGMIAGANPVHEYRASRRFFIDTAFPQFDTYLSGLYLHGTP
jgi:hypothetical protein